MKSKNISLIKLKELKKNITQIKKFLEMQSETEILIRKLDEINEFFEEYHFGLIFENHLEEIEENLKNQVISLSEIKDLTIQGAHLEHRIFEGENYTILKYLKTKYTGLIDLICIDPPYNTGNEMLGYNDWDYADNADDFPHSKWLSFMEKRLKLAKNLLSPQGVMFINIDETQVGCLILLCQQLFGEENVIVLIWPKTDPKYDKNRKEKPPSIVKIVHEYIVLCCNNQKITQFNKMLKRPNHTDFSTPEIYQNIESIVFETGTTSSAKDEMKKIFGNRNHFSTPKPMKLLKELIRVATTQNSIVLDFFAGSGTTGHAVIDLNSEDGGKRSFILVNNNENNICTEITYKRMKWVFEQYKCQDTLRYYKIQNYNK